MRYFWIFGPAAVVVAAAHFAPQAFVGFVVVALVGGAAESFAAFTAARNNRLDMSVGIALGSASQIRWWRCSSACSRWPW